MKTTNEAVINPAAIIGEAIRKFVRDFAVRKQTFFHLNFSKEIT